MGFSQFGSLQLASRNLAIPHVGLPTLRSEPLGASPDQPAPPCGQFTPGLSGAKAYDRRGLAEFAGCHHFWVAPAACGICRLACRTERRVEHGILPADALG